MDDMILRTSLGVLAIVSALCLGGYFVWHRHHQASESAKLENECQHESQAPVILPSSKSLDWGGWHGPTRHPAVPPVSKLGPLLKPEDIRLTREALNGTHEARKSPEAAPDPEAAPK
jgi:hypothetical protein